MAKNLVIVESPAKAKTIEGYLGRDYHVVASFGHVRDLPKSKLGIDVEHNFAPEYMIPRGSAKRINALKKQIEAAKTVYLATDLDREGEAIAWHISQLVPDHDDKKQKWHRITFSEITKPAVTAAIEHPREVNTDLVDAQQARRILDRLVGYGLSPVLWKKIRYGLSAGRVQSVALKFLIDREREIEAFQKVIYWTVEADLANAAGQDFHAILQKIDGKKAEVSAQKQADDIVAAITATALKITDITTRQTKKSPPPPFTTSTLQQAASSRLSYGTRRTMTVAQQLYEAGLISYMRTDSMILSDEILSQAKQVIGDQFGKSYQLPAPRRYKGKQKGAQEAHEAIRPTDLSKTPEQLSAKISPEQTRLYSLIWQRTLACQMEVASYEQTGVNIAAGAKGEYTLRATGRRTLFDGWTRVYADPKKVEEQELPKLSEGETLKPVKIYHEQHETQPPARYSEAMLVRKMEAEGIGRPSTYAPTISTLMNRGYVLAEDRRLVPQPIGRIVNDLLEQNFDFVTEPAFTARIEQQLDEVAEGHAKWQPIVAEFYNPMTDQIKTKQDQIERVVIPVVETDQKCELCGKMMVIKSGRFGQFLACSGWPDCKNTLSIVKDTGVECEKCHEGTLVERKTKKNRLFYGCSRYPKCDFATWKKPVSTEPKAD